LDSLHRLLFVDWFGFSPEFAPLRQGVGQGRGRGRIHENLNCL
jgi:hypothetical protein